MHFKLLVGKFDKTKRGDAHSEVSSSGSVRGGRKIYRHSWVLTPLGHGIAPTGQVTQSDLTAYVRGGVVNAALMSHPPRVSRMYAVW